MATFTIVVVGFALVVAAAAIALAPSGRRMIRARPHGGGRATGLPPGRVIYSDAAGGGRPLTARRYPLLGKPDYVVLATDGRRIPVEIKSARAPKPLRGRPGPRHEDVLQVVTYLIILDDLYEPAPRYGLLRYADATFEVPYTPELRDEVLDLLAEMQALDGAAESADRSPRGDPASSKCRTCAFHAICDDAVV